MITFKHLNSKGLLAYVRSTDFVEAENIAITTHRAISQTKNPRALAEDILLILAERDGIMVGYAGVLPDDLHLSNGLKQHMGWLSGLWVSTTERGKGIGKQLIEEACLAWDNKLFSADYAPLTKRLYHQTGKFEADPYVKKGLRLYVQSDLANLLPPKSALFRHIKSMLKILDMLLNIPIRWSLNMGNYPLNSKIELVEEIDSELAAFIEERIIVTSFKRGQQELSWILDYPWVKNDIDGYAQQYKYHFSSASSIFVNYIVKLRSSAGLLIGVMFLTKRDGNLKMPYFYHDSILESVVEVLNYLIVKWNIKTFTTFNKEISSRLRTQQTKAILKREIQRNYMISKAFAFEIDHLEIQDGDGDCAFT